jgi:hypothetical protein
MKHGGEIGRKRKEKKRRGTKKKEEEKNTQKNKEKNAPSTCPKAVANKLWLVLSIHLHPLSDVRPLVPPMPIPPMLGSGHHFFLLELKVA